MTRTYQDEEHVLILMQPYQDVIDRFIRLRDEWKSEALFDSNMSHIVTNKGYQQIIGMGPAAIPLILQSLAVEPDWWFWALSSITGEDPAEGTETLMEARTAWLDWGIDHYYIILQRGSQ